MKAIHYWLLAAALVLGWLGAQQTTRGAGPVLGDVLIGFIAYAVILYVGYGIYLLVRKMLAKHAGKV